MRSADTFGREYGWTIEDVRRLTVAEHNELMRIIDARERKKARERKRGE